MTTLLVMSALAFAAAIVYLFVGFVVLGRPTSDRNRFANRTFAMWWIVLGISTAATALVNTATYFGMRELLFHTTFTLFNIFLICLALWGLLHYLLFLLTGKNFVIALTVGYVMLYFVLVYYVLSGSPQSVEVTPWSSRLFYADPPAAPFRALVVTLLLGPQIASAVGFLGLYFGAETREQRFRVVTVGVSILVWFATSLVVAATGAGENWTWQIASRALGLGAALAILMAYRPPSFFRRRWAIRENPAAGAAVAVNPMKRVAPASSPLSAQRIPVGTAS